MRDHLSPSTIIAAWETGATRKPLDQALAVIWAADGCDASDWSLVDRDRRLLALKVGTFGAAMPVRASCPECDAPQEAELDANLLSSGLTDKGLRYRPMTSRDLARVADLPPERIAEALCARLAPEDADPQDAVRNIEADAAAAEISVRLTCSDCGANWVEALDVPAHFWSELARAAQRLLTDVAMLAAAFGWSEADILAMGPTRRRAYLALTGAA